MPLTVNIEKLWDQHYKDSSQPFPVDGTPTGTAAVATDAIWDAKGDLAVGTNPDSAQKLSVGTNGQVLTADSTQTTGIKWATPAAGGGSGGISPASYDVYISGGTASAWNNLTQTVDYTGADASVVTNAILAGWGAGAYGGTIDIVPPTSGELAWSVPALIPVDMQTCLIRCNGAVLQPTGSNQACFAPLRRFAFTTGALSHTATTIPLAAMPSWVSAGSGTRYINIGHDLWAYTGISGNNLTGASIQLGSVHDQSAAATATKPWEAWQNITIRDVIIDAINVTGSVDCSLIGTYQGSSTRDARLNIDNFAADCYEVRNAATSTDDSVNIRCFCLTSGHQQWDETIANTISRVRLNDWKFTGANNAVLILGDNDAGAATNHGTNIQITDVRVERGWWDSGLTATAQTNSACVQVGQYATGDDIVIADVHGRNSPDVGIELDQMRKARVVRCTMEECFNAGFYATNFAAAAPDQELVFERCTYRTVAMGSTVNSHGFQFAVGASINQFHHIILDDCSMYLTGAKSIDDRKGIAIANGTAITFDSLTIKGQFRMYGTSVAFSNASAGSLTGLYLQNATGKVIMEGPIMMTVDGTQAGGGNLVVAGIRIDTGATIVWDGYAPRVTSLINDSTNGTTNIMLLNKGAHSGILHRGMLGMTTGGGGTWGDFFPNTFATGSTMTIPTSLIVADWDYSGNTAAPNAPAVPGGQTANFHVGATQVA